MAVLIGLATGFAAPVAGQAERRASPAIVCPLAHSTSGTAAACCGPPVATPGSVIPCCAGSASFCCPPNAACAQIFTLSAQPSPSLTGRPVTLSGSLPGGEAGTRVTVWRQVAGARAFDPGGTATTTSAGRYSLTLHPRTDDAVYATAGAQRTATIVLAVRALVSLRGRAGPRGSVTLSGSVSPSHVGERVLVERQAVGRAWRVIARPRLDHRSRYRIRVAGTALRIVLPADARNVTSLSPVLTFPG